MCIKECCILTTFLGDIVATMLAEFLVAFFCLATCVRIFWFLTSGRYVIKCDLNDKRILITGASSGIGLATARELAKRKARLWLLCRNVVKASELARKLQQETRNKHVYVLECDLESLASVRRCAETFLATGEPIDVLVNNAGVAPVYNDKRILTEDNLEWMMAANYFGHFLLTNLLLNRMKENSHARIVNVGSLTFKYANDFDVNNLNFDPKLGSYLPRQAYAWSKLAFVLFTRELAGRLKGSGVTANILHPGIVHTNIFRLKLLYVLSCLFKTPTEGAQTTLYLATATELRYVSGHYFEDCTPKDRSLQALDDQLAENLWSKSMQLTKLDSVSTKSG